MSDNAQGNISSFIGETTRTRAFLFELKILSMHTKLLVIRTAIGLGHRTCERFDQPICELTEVQDQGGTFANFGLI
jgi:hypothetical protein